MIDIAIYEIIEIIFYLISLIITFVASLKLFANNEIPNSKLLLIALIGIVVGALLPLLETFYIIEESELFNSIVNIYLGVMFVIGAYGFWCLVQYSINLSTNKASQSTPKSGATEQ